ncbi:peptidyl-prolyl cis-trans isomerase [Henriciella pelagia]|jgi:hypothetical protein|uniref:PpiC domain-containing protein n=1 Tax=Henriciella pelagia TaxID=1977912 RepID=A0ABQ1JCD3_9PROT|nr:peptidylprolyl isomerase [Henriciella pelagia]GGB64978.1 hypothetical protein GCM10011503_12250 [Henriciella pelagia]
MNQEFLRQPFLYFLLGALILFGIDAVRNGTRTESSIVVSEAEIARLASGWERTWGSAPTDQELSGLIDDWIAEEIYVRQAEALGLGDDDPLIRKYLRRKMELLTEGVVIVPDPEEDELRAYYEANIYRFSPEPLVSFRQAQLQQPERTDYLSLVNELNRGAEADTLDAFTETARMQLASRFHVSRKYGVSFYDEVVGIAPGVWQGPVASSVGVHLVKVEAMQTPEPIPFDAARPAVEAAWRAARRDTLEQEAFERLKSYYDISVEAAPE